MNYRTLKCPYCDSDKFERMVSMVGEKQIAAMTEEEFNQFTEKIRMAEADLDERYVRLTCLSCKAPVRLGIEDGIQAITFYVEVGND